MSDLTKTIAEIRKEMALTEAQDGTIVCVPIEHMVDVLDAAEDRDRMNELVGERDAAVELLADMACGDRVRGDHEVRAFLASLEPDNAAS